jgi:hypothetical protein
MGHEDRQIAHYHDAASAAGIAKALPLFEEEKLGQLVHPDLACAAGRPARDSRPVSLGDLGLPCCPGPLVMCGLDRHEECEIVQPVRMAMAELIEATAHGGRRCRIEPIEHVWPEGRPMRDDGREIDVAISESLRLASVRR